MKNLSREIHENALKAAFDYKKSEAALISVIQQVQEFRVFLEFGYASLFEYVTKALGLSEASAYNFIAVSRKAIEIPEIKEAIGSGQLTVSKVRKVIPVIDSENKDEWLQKAMILPQRALELEVARIAPHEIKNEKVTIVTEEIRELRISVSKELYEKLKRVQAIERASSMQETLERMVDEHIEKKDPVRRAEKLITKVKTPVSRQVAVKHHVHARDQGRCTFVDRNGVRCGNQNYTEIHHIVPRSEGGSNQKENQTTLCSAHHRLVHY